MRKHKICSLKKNYILQTQHQLLKLKTESKKFHSPNTFVFFFFFYTKCFSRFQTYKYTNKRFYQNKKNNAFQNKKYFRKTKMCLLITSKAKM